ncbi:MAG: hypothetical protein HYY49_10215 [Ignavibacteriales bacterium]|nr:hypothetical protein [Ignavibacteriales bacterium]
MTEKMIKLLTLAAIVGLLAMAILFLYTNSRLNDAIDRLVSAEERLESSLTTLQATMSTVDSVQKDLVTFGSYVRDIQHRVEILDLSQRVADERFRVQKTELTRRLRELYKELETTGKSLPDIPVVSAERKN